MATTLLGYSFLWLSVHSAILVLGALEEVDWLRNKLETLEKGLKESMPSRASSQILSVRSETDQLIATSDQSARESSAAVDG